MRRSFVLLFALIVLSQLVFAGRYYDAKIGRFLQIDPDAHKYPNLSTYAYVANNPLRNIDPDGKGIKEFLTKMAEATRYEVTAGLQLGGSATIGGKGVELKANLVSAQVISGDLKSAPEVLNGDLSRSAGAKIGVAGISVETTLSGTKETTTHEGVYTKIEASNSMTTTVTGNLGPAEVGKQTTETRTANVLTGEIKSETKTVTQVGTSDIKVSGAVGVGVSVQVNTQKAWEAVKELFK